MAKANYVSFYGQVIQNPQLKMNQNSEIFQGRTILKVIRRFTDENKRLEYSTPIIVTGNPEIARQMTTLKKGDMCYLKGVITTLNVTRSWICPNCNCKNNPPGNYTMITPLFIQKEETLSNLEKDNLIDIEGVNSLKAHNEISNTIHVIGTVCKKNELFVSENGAASFNFQIATNRRFRLVEGDPSIRTDYPWVRVYGELAKQAAEVLDINSTVFIDGSLYTKTVEKKDSCEKCGADHIIKELVSEIHPYSIEYLHNCNLPEKAYTENEDYRNPTE